MKYPIDVIAKVVNVWNHLQQTYNLYTNNYSFSLKHPAVIWTKYCRFGVKHHLIDQSAIMYYTVHVKSCPMELKKKWCSWLKWAWKLIFQKRGLQDFKDTWVSKTVHWRFVRRANSLIIHWGWRMSIIWPCPDKNKNSPRVTQFKVIVVPPLVIITVSLAFPVNAKK